MGEAIYMRKATLDDLDAVWEIIQNAKKLLKEDGSEQWQSGYPSRLSMEQDIEANSCYLLMYGDKIVGTGTLMLQGDTHYAYIVDGKWNRPGHPFATINRIAITSGYRGKHFANYIMSTLISIAYGHGVRNIRISTHELNKRVHNLVLNFGFVQRGKVYTGPTDKDIRNAYELNM
ncbi:MAG TPA: GNAT family N-acetyltransferase [Candidatus Limosilactobacillus merdigallinarum]|uniref:GNAT family N-acetyltransferase n=1 Tax=Candidatus Limosilactobacillus merdigallinarum TaxID=2838652 RepID=A0A9D1VHF2_9LACO|nr:GNAT family N-acetyltransferase [Candidatus Limosilactobacillus merdigallinarum]